MISTSTVTTTTSRSFCPAVYEYICWPPTAANRSINISCTPLPHLGVDPTKTITRFCSPTGKWTHVNFAGCFYPDVLALMDQSYNGKTVEEKEVFQRIVRAIRYIELVGLSVSLMGSSMGSVPLFT